MRVLFERLRTLRARLTIWYAVLTALILLLFSLWLRTQLERSFSDQLDASLQVAAAQAATQLDESGDTPRFQSSEKSALALRRLAQAGYAVRIVGANGAVVAGVGPYEIFPAWHPSAAAFLKLEHDEISWRGYSQPIDAGDGRVLGALQVFRSSESTKDAVESFQGQLLLSIPFALLLIAIGGLFLAERALRPVNQITRTVEAISATQLSQRIGYRGPRDELGRLAQTFDHMLDRLQAGIERERRFIADASHELRTPLTSIKGQISLALTRRRAPEEYESTLQELEGEVDRLVRLSHDLLYLARLDATQDAARADVLDMSALLNAVVEQLTPLAETQHVALEAELPPTLAMRGDADQLIRVFLNLLDNAIKFTPAGGRVLLRAERAADALCVEVADNGIGIPADQLPQLFERFHRVEAARTRSTGGAGLGLAIANEIVRLHGGSIDVRSELGRGSTFVVRLPLHGQR